ncbi:MAG: hypothetical protein ACRD2B_14010 [Terriglobia bacterium]
MASDDRTAMELTCPCCGASLTVDRASGEVLFSRHPQKRLHHRDLDHVAGLFQRDRAHRDALFQKSIAEQKAKSNLLERKFEEGLKKTRNEPLAPPLRDFDLD